MSLHNFFYKKLQFHYLIQVLDLKNCLQEKPTGTFAEAWSGVISASNVPLVDISKCLGSIMCRKDQKELLNIRKASFLLTNAMNKKALKEIEGAFL